MGQKTKKAQGQGEKGPLRVGLGQKKVGIEKI